MFGCTVLGHVHRASTNRDVHKDKLSTRHRVHVLLSERRCQTDGKRRATVPTSLHLQTLASRRQV
jgi:hypothetical protein